MGAGNVKAVYGLWGHLPDRPFRLLAFLALTAKDDDSPPRFWGGRETMAVGIGRTVPTGDDDESRKGRHATFEAVRWNLNQLIKAGAIERTRAASPGRTAEYVLRLTPGMAQAESGANGTDAACATTQTESAQRDRPSLRMAQAESGPEDYKDHQGLISGLTTSSSAQPSVGASARCQCGHDVFASDGDCLRCGETRGAA